MKRRDFIKSSLTAVAATVTVQTIVGRAWAGSALKVGVMIPLSGPAGLFGPASKNVSQMAADDINAAGGILGRQVELVFADAGLPPAEAAQPPLRLWRGDRGEAMIVLYVGH